MAFPTIVNTGQGQQTSNTTNHTINLPASIVAGQLLLIFFTWDIAAASQTTGGWTGYTNLYNLTSSNNNTQQVCYRKIADGTEGATLAVTTSGSEQSSHVTYTISGHNGGSGLDKASATASATTQPDPPNLAPTWGAADNLWIATGVANGYSGTITYPYANGNIIQGGGLGGSGNMAICWKNLIASSDNPGAFQFNTGASDTLGVTIAVQPGGNPGAFLQMFY